MAADPEARPPSRPVLVWDGDCAFCRRSVLFLESRVGDAVETVPYQELGSRFPELDRGACEQAVHLVEPDGRITRGAEACFRALARAPGREWGLWLYRKLPGCAWITEGAYALVAGHRALFSRLANALGGRDPEAPTWVWSRRLFLTLLGVVYFVAFTSFWVQADLLVGSQGLFPLADTFGRVLPERGTSVLGFPTVFWLGQSDGFLHGICALGTACSVLLTAGVAPRAALVLLWLLYLSLTRVGDVFMSFQWESLLLESGFLAIFLAPAGVRPRERWRHAPSTLARLLLLWLLFRLLFRSGLEKLSDPVWADLTALQFHYWTQPLPAWTSFHVSALPDWVHTISAAGMFAIELVLPFLIFGPRRLRLVAFLGAALLQVTIMATGNYGFFNLNALALCVLLVDDQTMARLLPRRSRCCAGYGIPQPARWSWAMPVFALVMVPLSAIVWADPRGSGLLARVHRLVGPFQTVNRYQLFADMTTTRPELTLQGSDNATSWHSYEFHWKPGGVNRRPRFVQPHMPRVDWQMWFSALHAERLAGAGLDLFSPEVPDAFRERQTWLLRLLRRILEHNPDALELFSHNPFRDRPPKYLRVGLDEYRFAAPDHHARTGDWWIRLQVGDFITPVELDEDGRLQPAR